MTKIKIVGALVFSISILLTILFNYVSQKNKISNDILKTINQEKALTQEISKNIFYIYKKNDTSDFQLNNAIQSFFNDINNKENELNNINSLAIKNQNSKILILWNKFYLKVEKFRNLYKISTPYSTILLEKLVNDIYKINLELIMEFDKLLNLHQEELQNELNRYKNIEYALFFFLVILLIYLFTQIKQIFIFIQKFSLISKKIINNPSIKNLEPIKDDEIASNKSLSDATNNFNLLIQQLNNSVNHSADSIERSCESLEVVEKNIEDVIEFIYAMEDEELLDKNLTKKEDIIIQSLEELTTSMQNLKKLKIDLNDLVSQK
jgi:methyl-accepting chemotaxis protein